MTKAQRHKVTKAQGDKGTEAQRDRGTEAQRDRGTEGQSYFVRLSFSFLVKLLSIRSISLLDS